MTRITNKATGRTKVQSTKVGYEMKYKKNKVPADMNKLKTVIEQKGITVFLDAEGETADGKIFYRVSIYGVE